VRRMRDPTRRTRSWSSASACSCPPRAGGNAPSGAQIWGLGPVSFQPGEFAIALAILRLTRAQARRCLMVTFATPFAPRATTRPVMLA
jgi:hypothetical protein